MKAHLLLVGDGALLRRSLAFALERADRLVRAATAEDALALARRRSPDLILRDIGLPGMDGLEARRRFQAQVEATVTFLTARRREPAAPALSRVEATGAPRRPPTAQ